MATAHQETTVTLEATPNLPLKRKVAVPVDTALQGIIALLEAMLKQQSTKMEVVQAGGALQETTA